MALLDRQGRLSGRVSLLDLAALLLLLVVSAPPVFVLRALLGWREIAISEIEPPRIVLGSSESHGFRSFMTIRGSGFTKECVVKLSEHVLGHPSAVTPSSLRVEVPGSLLPGLYQAVVTGPRRTAACIDPVSVSWKPSIASVKPGKFYMGKETTLNIAGEYFEPGCELFLNGQRMEQVERVGTSLLHLTVPARRFPPGEYVLSVNNPVSGQQAEAPVPIGVFGREFLPVLVTLRLEGVTRPDLEKLLEISRRRPVTANRVHFIHLEQVPPAPPPRKDQELHGHLSNWEKGPPKRKPEPPKTFSVLANAGLHANVVYSDERVRVLFAKRILLKEGRRFILAFGDLQFNAVILMPPKVLSRAQLREDLS